MRKLIIICLLSGSTIYSGDYYGFSLNIGTRGSGVAFHKIWQLRPDIDLGVETRFFDIKASDELLLYDYYTQQTYAVNEQSLVILPVFCSLIFFPFEGKIENNFSPFVAVKGGPSLVIDGDEAIDGFFDRWKKSKTQITFAGNISVGVDFRWMSQSTMSVGIGFDILPMIDPVDNESNYNGTLLYFTYNRTK